MSDDSQQAIIDFLAAPATHGGAPVTRIDTHAAAVFLAGKRALKIKRAVRFPFLDFSTLAKRKAACESELSVNRPYAPAIYKRVIPITREADGTLALAGRGEPVEWAVEMARFDESATLDHLAAEDRINDRLADALGRAVADAHDKAPPVADFGFADVLTEVVIQNDAELHERPDLFAADDVAALTQAARAALTRLRPLIERRERDGLVRRCHGDLHLGNIVLIDGVPVLFDAIEFDARIATADVLYDLAFLLMDLIERDLNVAATSVLNRYLVASARESDLDALAALPLFLSTRAAIRAKVTAARALHARDRAEAEQSARDYFALACRLIAPPEPQLVAVGGLSGTGKSVLARALAAHLPPLPGAVVLRSDIERKRLCGVAETERLPQSGYSAEMTERVYKSLGDKAACVLAAGHSAIVDAVFGRADEREAIARKAGGAPFHGLFLTADLATRVARVGARVADASDADAEVVRQQEHYDLGRLDWTPVDAAGTPQATLDNAVAVLRLH
jgi:aminoglycoside phosphotransferase family enzyme/predicted kinase